MNRDRLPDSLYYYSGNHVTELRLCMVHIDMNVWFLQGILNHRNPICQGHSSSRQVTLWQSLFLISYILIQESQKCDSINMSLVLTYN